jgi:thiamine monophosphate kinase
VLDTEALPLLAGPDSLPLALGGGEDYDLLFTSPDLLDTERCRRESGTLLTLIGRCTDGSGVTDTAGRAVPDSGYDHLR